MGNGVRKSERRARKPVIDVSSDSNSRSRTPPIYSKTASPRSANKDVKEGPKKRGRKLTEHEVYVHESNAKINNLRDNLQKNKKKMDAKERQKIRN